MWEALVTAVERAALAVWPLVGRGDKEEADRRAVAAMRASLASAPFTGTVVIGEGEMDEAPMLYIGERLGHGGPAVDIAVDPLEGTDLVAKAQPGAVTAIAVAEAGSFLHAPDMYMEKLVVGPIGRGLLAEGDTLLERLEHAVEGLRQRKGGGSVPITAVVLERDRHRAIVDTLRRLDVAIRFISAGDMMPAIATCLPESGVDLLVGIGGAPEGVLAAAAVRALGGDMVGRLLPEDDSVRQRLLSMGAHEGFLTLSDLARKPSLFAATAVTDAWGLARPCAMNGAIRLHTLLVDGATGIWRRLESRWPLDR